MKLHRSELHIPGVEGLLLGPIPKDRLSMHFLKNLIFIRSFTRYVLSYTAVAETKQFVYH